MKKIDVIHLIASLCLLFGNVLNLLNMFYDIPLWLGFFSIPLLFASIVLYAIVLRRQMKNKIRDDQGQESRDDGDST